jgi:hypothetical protein
MVKVNLIGGNIERWELNGLAHSFMREVERIVEEYRRDFADASKPEDKTKPDSDPRKRWYEDLPPEIVDDEYLRKKRDRIRLALSVFKDMEAKELIPEGDGPFRKKEIRKARRNFIKLLPKEDRREGKRESVFIKNTRQMLIIVIRKNNPMTLKRKLEEVEKRLDKLTAWGLEGLSI